MILDFIYSNIHVTINLCERTNLFIFSNKAKNKITDQIPYIFNDVLWTYTLPKNAANATSKQCFVGTIIAAHLKSAYETLTPTKQEGSFISDKNEKNDCRYLDSLPSMSRKNIQAEKNMCHQIGNPNNEVIKSTVLISLLAIRRGGMAYDKSFFVVRTSCWVRG